jgi:hypothetical protein
MRAQRLLIIYLLLFIASALLLGLVLATPAHCCTCCDNPSVKVEIKGHHWIYDEDINDGTIVVTGTERLLCWKTITGTAVIEIKTKSGQDIGCYEPQDNERFQGCIGAGRHDFSTAWFCTESVPTAIKLSNFSAINAGNECCFILMLEFYFVVIIIVFTVIYVIYDIFWHRDE